MSYVYRRIVCRVSAHDMDVAAGGSAAGGDVAAPLSTNGIAADLSFRLELSFSNAIRR